MTTPKRNAWMAFYPADYLRKTTRLTTEQHGAYLLLILDYWVNGAPPDDDAALAAITRLTVPAWKRMRPALAGFFTVADGKWTQDRVEEERTKATTITEIRSMAGKGGAARRWGSKRIANATPEPKANGKQLSYQPGKQTDAPSQRSIPTSSTESGSREDGSGMKRLSDGANEVLLRTLQAKTAQ